jgi:hypothetical protein
LAFLLAPQDFEFEQHADSLDDLVELLVFKLGKIGGNHLYILVRGRPGC